MQQGVRERSHKARAYSRRKGHACNLFRKRAKGANYLKIWAKMYKIWKYFEKGQPYACNYCIHETDRICPGYSVERKSTFICNIFKWMKALWLTNSSLALTSFCLIVFLFWLLFCLLSHFKIIRCIVKSLTLLQYICCWNTTEKENLKCFLGGTVWALKLVHYFESLPNSLNMS